MAVQHPARSRHDFKTKRTSAGYKHGQDEDEIAEIIDEVHEQCVAAATAGIQKGTLVATMSGRGGGRSSDQRVSPDRAQAARRRVESNDENAAVSIKVVVRVECSGIEMIGKSQLHRSPNDTPVAIHVEFCGVVTKQLQASGQHNEGHDARSLAVAVAGCEAARSALSKRTFDGRKLLAMFALEPITF